MTVHREWRMTVHREWRMTVHREWRMTVHREWCERSRVVRYIAPLGAERTTRRKGTGA